MKKARALAANVQALLQNRMMLWVGVAFLMMMVPAVLFLTFVHKGAGDLEMAWVLFSADFIVGYYAALLEFNILSRAFAFTLPGNSEVPGELLILLGILLNGLGLLYFWPTLIARVAAIHLLGAFMLGNFCFLVPAILSTILKSARTFVGILIPVQLLPLLVYRHWGNVFEEIIHPAATIPLGLLAWSLVWTRLRNRDVRRSLVGRTDFELANSWLNPAKVGKAWEKTSIEKRQGTGFSERILEGLFVRQTTSSISAEVKGVAGILYSVFGRLNYRTLMTAAGLLLFVVLEFYLTPRGSRPEPINHFAIFSLLVTWTLLMTTSLPKHFAQRPLSRRAKSKVAMEWNIVRIAMAVLVVFISGATFTLPTTGLAWSKLWVALAVPLYAGPFFMLAEIFIPNFGIALLFLIPVFLLWPNPSLWVSSRLVCAAVLLGLWGLLWGALVWRFQTFDLAGSRRLSSQAWSRRWVRMAAVATVGLGAVFLFIHLQQPPPPLEQRLVSTDDETRELAIAEFPNLFPVEKEWQIDRLIDVLRRDQYPQRCFAAHVLGRIGWRAQRALPVMAHVLKVNNSTLQWNILGALNAWGPAARSAAPAVYPILNAGDKYIRAMAARTLVAMEVPDAGRPAILRELTAAATYINKEDAERTLDSLGALGPAAQSALPILLKAAQIPTPTRPRHAVWALGRLGVKSAQVKEALIRGVRNPDANVELNSIISLVWVDPDALKSIPDVVARVKQFTDAKLWDNALLNAAYGDSLATGDLTDIQALLDLGANVNNEPSSQSMTPLMLAALGGHPDVVRLLLTRGADTSLRSTARINNQTLPSFLYRKGLWGYIVSQFTESLLASFNSNSQSTLAVLPSRTALAYAVEADLPPATKAEIVQLLQHHDKEKLPLSGNIQSDSD